MSVGPGAPPSTTAMTFGRPGATTSISGDQPNARIWSATSRAAGSSFSPLAGSWTLGVRTSCRVNSTSASASITNATSYVGGVKRPSAAVQPPSTKIVVPVT